jgi:hypothetical protein
LITDILNYETKIEISAYIFIKEEKMEEKRRLGYRSLFWPIVLIAVGIFWLLSNLDLIPEYSLWTLLRLWPLILVIIGLDILFGRRSPLIGAAIGIGAVALAVVLVLTAPTIGIVPTGETLKTETFSEPVGDATSAQLDLDLSIGKTTINALSDSTNLLDAEITYWGEIKFNVSGEKHKTISLSQRSFRFDFPDFNWFDTEDLMWDIGLSPDVQLSLDIEGSVGQSILDLRGLQIEEVNVSGDVGETTLSLPAMKKTYNVNIDGGVGRFIINLEESAAVNLTIDGDVGDFAIDVPDNAAVRVDAEVDIGDLHIDSRFDKISGGDDDFISESGVWETPGFASADTKIFIVFNGGIGSLRVN